MNNRAPHPVLAAAMTTPEEGVARPPRVNPASAITQIAALKVGESWSRVVKPNTAASLADFAADSATWRDDLRNAVQSSVRHAKNRSGGTYLIEVGDFISSARSIYLVCVVTRVE